MLHVALVTPRTTCLLPSTYHLLPHPGYNYYIPCCEQMSCLEISDPPLLRFLAFIYFTNRCIIVLAVVLGYCRWHVGMGACFFDFLVNLTCCRRAVLLSLIDRLSDANFRLFLIRLNDEALLIIEIRTFRYDILRHIHTLFWNSKYLLYIGVESIITVNNIDTFNNTIFNE